MGNRLLRACVARAWRHSGRGEHDRVQASCAAVDYSQLASQSASACGVMVRASDKAA